MIVIGGTCIVVGVGMVRVLSRLGGNTKLVSTDTLETLIISIAVLQLCASPDHQACLGPGLVGIFPILWLAFILGEWPIALYCCQLV